MKRYEYKIIDTSKNIEEQLNSLGAEGWQVVGVTTKKQLLIAPPQAIILMREVSESSDARAKPALVREHAWAAPSPTLTGSSPYRAR